MAARDHAPYVSLTELLSDLQVIISIPNLSGSEHGTDFRQRLDQRRNGDRDSLIHRLEQHVDNVRDQFADLIVSANCTTNDPVCFGPIFGHSASDVIVKLAEQTFKLIEIARERVVANDPIDQTLFKVFAGFRQLGAAWGALRVRAEKERTNSSLRVVMSSAADIQDRIVAYGTVFAVKFDMATIVKRLIEADGAVVPSSEFKPTISRAERVLKQLPLELSDVFHSTTAGLIFDKERLPQLRKKLSVAVQ